jgi:glycerophosphoryl diester phosphodiesterase
LIDHLYPHTPAVIAHRGASAAAPENTLVAFNLAAELGADAVELDVKLSKDGLPIVIHDETVDRTTDAKGKVKDFTLADFKQMDAGSWKDSKYAGERIPTLAEVFDSVGSRLWINVELTNYYTRGDNLVPVVVALIQKMNMQKRVLLSSFDPFNLRQARQLDPSLPVAQLTAHDMAIYLREAWLTFLAPHEARHPDVDQLKQKGVGWYHARKYRVNVWTNNDPNDMRDFVKQGVDGLITDTPDVAREVIRSSRS